METNESMGYIIPYYYFSFYRIMSCRFRIINARSEGYHCETVTTAEAALSFIRENIFDVMVTDVAMFFKKDGGELTEKAKKLRAGMAIIVMTEFIDDFSYDAAIEDGASDFIKKPFTLKEMRMRLKHVGLSGFPKG
jgi:DNA-binding NtrC family response regulator